MKTNINIEKQTLYNGILKINPFLTIADVPSFILRCQFQNLVIKLVFANNNFATYMETSSFRIYNAHIL